MTPRKPPPRPPTIGQVEAITPSPQHECEFACLGSVVLDPAGQLDGVITLGLKPEHFTSPALAAIYAAALDLHQSGAKVDAVTLAAWLRDRGHGDGLIEQMAVAAESVPSAASAPYYAREVIRRHEHVRMSGVALATAKTLLQTPANAEDSIRALYASLTEHITQADPRKPTAIGAIAARQIERMDSGEAPQTVPTGFRGLDAETGGLYPGDYWLIGARPSMGKTTFAWQIAEAIAGLGLTTLFFSLEMSADSLAQRQLSYRTSVSIQDIRRMAPDGLHAEKLRAAARELEGLPLIVDDWASTPATIRARVQQHMRTEPVSCVMIDYMQLIRPDSKHDNRNHELTVISSDLKRLAKDLNVPVVALSQLNRGPEGRENKRPSMGDLRDSGSLEQDADLILFLHREDYYHRNDRGYMPTGSAEVIIAKQRNGGVGILPMRWGGQRFLDGPVAQDLRL